VCRAPKAVPSLSVSGVPLTGYALGFNGPEEMGAEEGATAKPNQIIILCL